MTNGKSRDRAIKDAVKKNLIQAVGINMFAIKIAQPVYLVYGSTDNVKKLGWKTKEVIFGLEEDSRWIRYHDTVGIAVRVKEIDEKPYNDLGGGERQVTFQRAFDAIFTVCVDGLVNQYSIEDILNEKNIVGTVRPKKPRKRCAPLKSYSDW